MMKVQLVWSGTQEVEELNCFGYDLCDTTYTFYIPYNNKDGKVKYCVPKRSLEKVVRVS